MTSSLKLCCCHSSTFVCTFCWVVQVLVRRVYAPLGATGTGPPSPKDRSHTCFFWQLCIPHETQCFLVNNNPHDNNNFFSNPNNQSIDVIGNGSSKQFGRLLDLPKRQWTKDIMKLKSTVPHQRKVNLPKIVESLKFATNNHTIRYFVHFFCQLSLEPVQSFHKHHMSWPLYFVCL